MRFPATRILLVCTRQIGDVLLTTPLLRSLRRAYPAATVDALVFTGRGGMLAGNPDCDGVIEIGERPSLVQHYSLLRRIRRHYDLALSVLAGDRPLLYAWLAASQRVAVVPAYRRQDAWKHWICAATSELDNLTTHTVVQNLRLADRLGIARDYTVVPPRQSGDAESLDRNVPFDWRCQPFAVLHPTPQWRYKRWSLTGWARLAEWLDRRGLRLVLSGGPGAAERAYLDAVLAALPRHCVDLASRLGFSAWARLLAAARLYIGPDTAMTHLAAATGVPTVALYGPTNPLKWAPWPHGYAGDTPPFAHTGGGRVGNVLLIQGQAPCVPCHLEGCERQRRSYSRCLDALPASRVIGLIEPTFRV